MILHLIDPEFVVPIRPEDLEQDADLEYEDANHDLDPNTESELNYKARIVIIATGVLGGLLIVVVAAIICKSPFILLLMYAK